jgi:hypothetical protein
MQAGDAPARGRIAIAIGAALLLGGLIAIVLHLSAGEGAEDRVTPAADQRCVTSWNTDPAATAYGRHNFNFHDYEGALVTFLSKEAAEVAPGEGGLCAVIFPSGALDQEPVAAGQVLRGRLWLPIIVLEGVEAARVGELQAIAARDPNALLDARGRLTGLDG